MTKMDDCTRFQEGLAAGSKLDPTEREQLRRHADSCTDCAAVRRLHEELEDALSNELAAQVPDEMVADMWPRVQAAREAAARPSRRGHVSVRAGRDWLTGLGALVLGRGAPLMAAAMVVLLLATGWLAGERARLKVRERDLLQRAERAESRASADVHTIGASPPRATRASWTARIDDLTASRARSRLAQLAPDTLLLDAPGAWRLLDDLLPASGFARRALPKGVDLSDGLQAGEALAVVDRVLADRPELARARVGSLRRAAGL